MVRRTSKTVKKHSKKTSKYSSRKVNKRTSKRRSLSGGAKKTRRTSKRKTSKRKTATKRKLRGGDPNPAASPAAKAAGMAAISRQETAQINALGASSAASRLDKNGKPLTRAEIEQQESARFQTATLEQRKGDATQKNINNAPAGALARSNSTYANESAIRARTDQINNRGEPTYMEAPMRI